MRWEEEAFVENLLQTSIIPSIEGTYLCSIPTETFDSLGRILTTNIPHMVSLVLLAFCQAQEKYCFIQKMFHFTRSLGSNL